MEIVAQRLGAHGAVIEYIGKSAGTHFRINLETGNKIVISHDEARDLAAEWGAGDVHPQV